MPGARRAHRPAHRIACAWVFGVLVVFAFTLGGALGAYPGGTFFDSSQRGYAFWSNFWCDMLRNPALNGESNARGAKLATLALWVLSAGLIPFWGVAASVGAAHRPALRVAIQTLGVVAMLGMMGVTLLPSDAYPRLHGSLVFVAGPPALLAIVLFLRASRSAPGFPTFIGALGTLAVALAVVNLGAYGREFLLHGAPWPLLPALQKVVTFLFLGWVVATCAVAFNRSRN